MICFAPFFTMIVLLRAASLLADDFRIAEVTELRKLLQTLDLQVDGKPIPDDLRSADQLRSLFNQELTRPGYQGKYLLQIDTDGQLTAWFSGGRLPNGKSAATGTYRGGEWTSRPRVLDADADFRIELFVCNTCGLPLPKKRQKSRSLTLHSIQRVIDRLDLRDANGARVRLESITKPTTLISTIHSTLRHPTNNGGYYLQIDDQLRVSVYFDGGLSQRGCRTFIKDYWDTSQSDPIPRRTELLEAALFRVLIPELLKNTPSFDNSDLQPFSFQLPKFEGGFEETEKAYLQSHPEHSSLVARIKLLSHVIAKCDVERGRAKAAITNREAYAFRMGILLSDVPENEELRRKVIKDASEQTADAEAAGIIALKTQYFAEQEKSTLLKSIATEEMQDACRHYPSREPSPFSKRRALQQLAVTTAPTDIKYFHLLLEQVPLLVSREERRKLAERALKDASEQFNLDNPESIHLAILTQKALTYEIQWNDKQRSEYLAKAVDAAQNSLTRYVANTSTPRERLAKSHQIMGAMLKEFGIRSSGPSEHKRLRYYLHRAEFHRKRAEELANKQPE